MQKIGGQLHKETLSLLYKGQEQENVELKLSYIMNLKYKTHLLNCLHRCLSTSGKREKESLMCISKYRNGLCRYGMYKVLYMSSSFWLLEVESRDFSQAEKERAACKAGQIHKMTTIFTQNDNLGQS